MNNFTYIIRDVNAWVHLFEKHCTLHMLQAVVAVGSHLSTHDTCHVYAHT